MTAAVAFGAFEAQTGLSSQELQRWQNVAFQANVSAESVTSSVTALQRQLSEIRMGRGNISPFQILGIDPRGDAFKVIDQLREKVKGMDRGTATNLISQMGLTPDMMQVLTLSDEKFKSFSKTITGMSPAQVAAFQRLRLELNQLKMQLYDLAYKVMAPLIPQLTSLIHNILPPLIGFVERMVTVTGDLYHWFSQTRGMLPALAVSLLALSFAFAPITTSIIALLLLIDDFYVYMHGGKSMIGDTIEVLKKIFTSPIESAKIFLSLLNDIMGALSGGKGSKLTDQIKDFVSSLMDLPPAIIDALTGNGTDRLRRDVMGNFVFPAPATAGSRTFNQSNTFHIHSTEPAEDMAYHVEKVLSAKSAEIHAQTGHEDGIPQ